MDPVLRYLRFPENRKTEEEDTGQKRVWIADPVVGFRLCTVIEETDRDISVGFRDAQGFFEKKRLPHAECFPVSRNSYADDLCTLTEPNVATVYDSLQKRYAADIIHTYSGLFCLFINPWRKLPIYGKDVMDIYRSKLDLSPPPHVFAVAQAAYDGVRRGGTDQSILITGESGSGKTENTKRIIEFVLNSCGAVAERVGQDVIACGEVLEAFGSAATLANANSSRFGKFIKIEFNEDGRMQSASIECYLLERSRVVNQNEGERNFHIFHQLLSGAFGEENFERLGFRPPPSAYRYLSGGGAYAEPIDDLAVGKNTDAAFDRLGFTHQQKAHVFEILASCILLGEIRFGERSGLDMSYVEGSKEIDAVAALLGIRPSLVSDCLTQPTIRVGENTIRKNQNLKKTLALVAALSKTLYERLFNWVLDKCNAAIYKEAEGEATSGTHHSIGVLDIAGFEIIQVNSFEQLCINYTNEKLQQFFNHFMFVREQTEYLEEGIKWSQTDYAFDLQPTIEIFERPLGLFTLLEEECVVPNGSEPALLEKWTENFKEADQFSKAKPSQKTNSLSHFTIKHYAGIVDYNIDGWLEKDRDAVEFSILETMSQSQHRLIADLFPHVDVDAQKPKKGGLATATVTFVYRNQLCSLLDALNQTSAHFIRCLLPNREKQPGKLNAPLVLHQLRCNGVLEGIRICRQGYPNRLPFDQFVERYGLVVGKEWLSRNRAAARELCDLLKIEESRVQIGNTRVFCKVGVISELEEHRREKLTAMMTCVQTEIRTFLAVQDYKIRVKKCLAVDIIQWNVRAFNRVAQWPWHRLLTLVHPLIPKEREKERILELERRLRELEEERARMMGDNKELCTTIQSLKDNARLDGKKAEEAKERVEKMLEEKMRELHEVRSEMHGNEEIFDLLEGKYQQQQKRIAGMSESLREYERKFEKLDYERKERERELQKAKEHLERERSETERIQKELMEAQMSLKELEGRTENVLKEKRRLVEAVARLENARDEHMARARKQSDLVAELQETISDLTERLTKADSNVGEERNQRRKAERELEKVKDELGTFKAEAEKMLEKYDSMKDVARDKDNLIKKLEKKLADKESLMEECMKDLRESHKHRVDELKDELDELRRKNSRLETDNITHKSRVDRSDSNFGLNYMGRSLERESSLDSDYGRLSSGRHSMDRSLTRQYSITSVPSFSTMRHLCRRRQTEPDIMEGLSRVPSSTSLSEHQRKIQELERHLQDAKTEVNLKNRELDVYKSSLHAVEQERDSFNIQLKAAQGELERLHRENRTLTRANQNLELRLKAATDDGDHWKHRMEETIAEMASAIETERNKTIHEFEETQHEKDLKHHRLVALERSKDELTNQLTDTQVELDRALARVLELQTAFDTQETVGKNWEHEYRQVMHELEGLRDENGALKSKIRRQYKQIEILTRQDDSELALTSMQEKVDKLNGRMED